MNALMNALAWLESLPPSDWVATSDWGYPLMLSIHSIGMAAVVGLLFMLDFRVLGYASRIPVTAFRKFMPFAWFGFALNFTSGLLLFGATATRLVTNWPFVLKMICIVIGGILTFWLWRELGSGAEADAIISKKAKRLAVASLALWIGAIVFGRLIAYIMDQAILTGE